MDIKTASRKTFDVNYVQVDGANIDEVAAWCGGVVAGEEEKVYVSLVDKNAINTRQTKAFIGDYILSSPTGFKAYGKKAFAKSFVDKDTLAVTHHKVARDAATGEFVDKAYADANPDTTVVENVDIKHEAVDRTQEPTQMELEAEVQIKAANASVHASDADPS